MIRITITDTAAKGDNTNDLLVDGCIVVTYRKSTDGALVDMYCSGARDMRMERAIAVVNARVADGTLTGDWRM